MSKRDPIIMKITVDKIASVTKNVPLTRRIEISDKIISKEGYVLVVEILQNKKIYNQLELRSGRLSTLKKRDIIVVALGNRRALQGFSGEVPKHLKTGDTINILNLGGVAGICKSENYKKVGHALKAKVLGAVVGEKGKALSVMDYRLFEPAHHIKSKIPLVVVSGTCMNVGKTSACCEIIKEATRSGYRVLSTKVTGIAALRDTANMHDYGAKKAVSIIDAGFTSSTHVSEAIGTAKGAINYLTTFKPDFIVVELGDGILGEYGVVNILKDDEFKKNIVAHVGCANDPPGAMKLQEICKKIKTPLDLVSGPVSDNSVGVTFVKKNLKIQAINSLSDGEKIFAHIKKRIKKPKKRKLE